MGKRLLTLSLCALGVAGLASSGTASASTGTEYKAVHVYDANGYNRTVDCPTTTAAPECDEDQLQVVIGMSHGTANGAIAAFRMLDEAGLTVMEGFNNDASLHIVQEIDRTGAPGATKGWAGLPAVDASARTAKRDNGGAKAANKKHGKKAAKHANSKKGAKKASKA